jgi:alkylation response protein AidB-like acyl-CoA dehydrogenase
MLNSANQAWTMYPGLSHGAYECVHAHGTPELQKTYLPKLVSGIWTGTMCLTEPHCGTDLGMLRTKAEPNSDGSYSISGTPRSSSPAASTTWPRTSSTWCWRASAGCAERHQGHLAVHRAEVHSERRGAPGERNTVKCGSIEHKMGIHGNSTCRDQPRQAKGWLVGEPNKGLNAMFVMMNAARLGVGMQAWA